MSRFAVNVDKPSVLLNDTINRRQTQPASFPDSLGGEKRFEKVLARLRTHAAPIVAHSQHRKCPGNKSGMISAVVLVECDVLGLDGDLAHPRNGITGIDTQVCHNLIDLGGVDLDRPQIHSRHPGQADVFADEPSQHLEHPSYCFV